MLWVGDVVSVERLSSSSLLARVLSHCVEAGSVCVSSHATTTLGAHPIQHKLASHLQSVEIQTSTNINHLHYNDHHITISTKGLMGKEWGKTAKNN